MEVVQKATAEYKEGCLKYWIEEQRAKEMTKKRVNARRLVRDWRRIT